MPSDEINILKRAADEMNKSIQEEFSKQGHTLTGAAERSLTAIVKKFPNKTEVECNGVDYIIRLDEGLEPNEISVDENYINGLIRYVQLRMGLQGRAAVRAAYAIAKKHKEEGMPTEASARFSTTGERKDFLSAANNDQSNMTDEIVSLGLDQMIDTYFLLQQNEIV